MPFAQRAFAACICCKKTMRILLVTNDRLGRQRAGPAIRCVELAKVLAREHEVTVASGVPGDIELPGINVILNALANPAALRAAARQSDVAITQGPVLHVFPFLRRLCRYLVVDLYDPYLFEHLAQKGRSFAIWRYLRQWHLLNQQLRHGDFFICANERQWDYWLGCLCALGRLTPEEHERDPSFRRLLSVVPFGIEAQPPRHERPVVKGVMPGIAKDDIVFMWAGGIWQWFDPLTIIKAMGQVRDRAHIKLLFLGTRHPNPDIPEMPILAKSRKLAEELGLLGRSVFFREGWVPFDERQNFLLEADIGVSAHTETVETRLAFRTRVLDYIWAGLPMILTEGDYFADLVARNDVGKTVSPGDTKGWKEAIVSLAESDAEREAMKSRLSALRERFYWEKVAEPLAGYCRDPYHTRGLSSFRVGFSRFLTSAYRELQLLQRRKAARAFMCVEGSRGAKFVDNGDRTHL
jgi:glycosyltransferase involved in cell wall biosynthesis